MPCIQLKRSPRSTWNKTELEEIYLLGRRSTGKGQDRAQAIDQQDFNLTPASMSGPNVSSPLHLLARLTRSLNDGVRQEVDAYTLRHTDRRRVTLNAASSWSVRNPFCHPSPLSGRSYLIQNACHARRPGRSRVTRTGQSSCFDSRADPSPTPRHRNERSPVDKESGATKGPKGATRKSVSDSPEIGKQPCCLFRNSFLLFSCFFCVYRLLRSRLHDKKHAGCPHTEAYGFPFYLQEDNLGIARDPLEAEA